MMSSRRKFDKQLVFVGTAALIVVTVVALGAGVALLLDAWKYYQRRADAQLMYPGFAVEAAFFLFYAGLVGSLAAAVVKLPSHRPRLLLAAGALTGLFGVWAVSEDWLDFWYPAVRITAASSVIAGVCALSVAVALYRLGATAKATGLGSTESDVSRSGEPG
jgi:hypothetical protein